MTTPAHIPQMPADLVAMLDDPRLADMQDAPDKLARSTRILEPRDPPQPGESRFLLLREERDHPIRNVRWVNEPQGLAFISRTGGGQGFDLLTERPRFEQAKKKHDLQRDVWSYSGWLIASPLFVDVLRRFDPTTVETVEIDWLFADGQRLDGYVFLDVRRCIHAYDYARTRLVVEMNKGQKFISGLGYPRAVKADIDSSVHVFRDAFYRSDVFMSYPLAKAVAEAGVRGMRFEDPASVHTVRFN